MGAPSTASSTRRSYGRPKLWYSSAVQASWLPHSVVAKKMPSAPASRQAREYEARVSATAARAAWSAAGSSAIQRCGASRPFAKRPTTERGENIVWTKGTSPRSPWAMRRSASNCSPKGPDWTSTGPIAARSAASRKTQCSTSGPRAGSLEGR